MRPVLIGAALLMAAGASAQTTVADRAGETQIRFIACPVYRDVDAGRKSGCWLADDPLSGVRYDVGLAPTKPDWNREALIEGRVSARPDVCGGVVLDAVRVSVLPGACSRHSLPAETWQGRPFVLPPRNVRPASEPRPAPSPPFAPTLFHLFFDWDRDFLVYQLDDYLFDRAVAHIRGVNPKVVRVTGFSASAPAVISGRRMVESPTIARRRAQTVAEALRRMGVPAERIEVRTQSSSTPVAIAEADGLLEPSRRRVEIEVLP